MDARQLELFELADLLGLEPEDTRLQQILAVLGVDNRIEQFETYGWIECKSEGVSIMFKRLSPVTSECDRRNGPFRLVAFHLHREGHDGYVGYKGKLDGNVRFGDTNTTAHLKLKFSLPAGR